MGRVGNPCTSEHYQKVGDQVIFNLKFAADRGFISSNLYKFLEGNCVTDRHGPNKPDFTNPGCTTGWRLYYLATSDDDGLGPRTDLPHGGFVDPYTAYGPNEKDFDVMLREYMNWDAVKVALNVQDSPASPWGTPHLSYTKQYYACYYGISGDEPPPQYNSSMLPLYRRLAGKLQSITVYNGDTDPSIQFQGTEDAIRGLGLDVAKGGSWRPWFYMPKPAPVSLLVEKPPYWGGNLNHRALHSPQLAGYVTNYADNVTFATFHNSGHMVPMFRPQAALHFFERVMKGSALAPDLDMDMVERSSDDDFFGEGYMSRWVARAQSAEFTDSQSFHAAPGHRADGQRTARRADRLIDIV